MLAVCAVLMTLASTGGPLPHERGQRLLLVFAVRGLIAALGGGLLFGGRGALGFPPMPTWAMISVIVGWSGIGAWRMMTRDA